eukprot:m.12996 g.12996  ORF g.12996 m.12996 type:complete len:489 (-) comp4090_c0_seq1:60-1526(-)
MKRWRVVALVVLILGAACVSYLLVISQQEQNVYLSHLHLEGLFQEGKGQLVKLGKGKGYLQSMLRERFSQRQKSKIMVGQQAQQQDDGESPRISTSSDVKELQHQQMGKDAFNGSVTIGDDDDGNVNDEGTCLFQQEVVDVTEARFAVVVMVSNKEIHYKFLVESLLRSDFPNNTHVVVTHDSKKTKQMEALTFRLRERFIVSHFFHPYSCMDATQDSIKGGFPRYYKGEELPGWRYSCPKHHWFWAMNRIFRTFKSLEWMYYLEEDFIIAKHIASVINSLIAATAESSNMMGAMTQCRDNLWTVSGLLKRSTWQKVVENVEFFCHFNEYNWDLTLKQLLIQSNGTMPRDYLCSTINMAEHTGDFGVGLTRGKDMSDAEIEENVAQRAKLFYESTDNAVGTLVLKNANEEDQQTCSYGRFLPLPMYHDVVIAADVGTMQRKWIGVGVKTETLSLHTKHSGLGGFHDVHQSHCMSVFNWFETRFHHEQS